MGKIVTYTTRRKDVLETTRYAMTSYSNKTSTLSPSGTVSEYYTKTELQTSGSAEVHWDNISNKPFVNVKDFGAVGDDVTDDYAAIISAIDSLGSSSAMGGGGIVFFPEGIYLIRDEIELHDFTGMSFIGVGEKTIIHADGFSGRHFKFVDCTSIHIENMKLVGDTIDSSLSTGGIWFNLSGNSNNAYHVLRNLYITDITNTGVTMNTPILTIIENVVCRYCLGDSFFFYNGTSVTLTACFALTSTECGFNFYNMTYCTLNSCAAEVNGVCYNFENSKAITLNSCGAEDPIYRSATFPGYSYRTLSAAVITAIACYSRGADAISNCIYEETGSRFDVINFKDSDETAGANYTKINSLYVDYNGNGKITKNQNTGTSFLVTNEIALGNTFAVAFIGVTARGTSNLLNGYFAMYPIDFHTTYYQGKLGIITGSGAEGIFICPDTTNKPIDFIVGGNSVYTPAMRIIGTNYTACTIGTPTFSSGFAGSGWQLGVASGNNTLTVDNLVVRQALTAYELDINKINSVNGGIIVSAANGTALTVSGTTIYMDEDGSNKLIQFQVNDYIRAQVWTGRGIASYIGLVTAVNHSTTYGSANIIATTISGTPWNGMEIVQIGNTTDTARQNLIYITASDTNNPYIDMLAGVNDGSFAGKQKLRIGNLTGITDSDFGGALSGYGLYANNIYLKGAIVISNPEDIDQTTLTNAAAAGATVGATWGSNLYSIPSTLSVPSGSGLYLSSTYMGFYNGSTWKTYMDNSGNLVLGDYAGGNAGLYWDQNNGVLNVRGVVAATSGVIGGWSINSAYLAKDTGTDATSAGMAPADYPFYGGSTYTNRATASFRVTNAGVLTAFSGTVGGWTMGTDYLRSAASGKRVLLDKTNNRITIFSAVGDGAYIRMDDDIYATGYPGIAFRQNDNNFYTQINSNRIYMTGTGSYVATGVNINVNTSGLTIQLGGLPMITSETGYYRLYIKATDNSLAYLNV